MVRARLRRGARHQRAAFFACQTRPHLWEGCRGMGKGRILVVEDDFDISNMLRIYFSGQG